MNTSEAGKEQMDLEETEKLTHQARWLTGVCIAGVSSAVIYAFILYLSFEFQLNGKNSERPILTVLSLFTVAFLIYLTISFLTIRCFPRSIRSSLSDKKASQPNISPSAEKIRALERNARFRKRAIWIILSFGVLFRMLIVFSNPIQEIDIYRYVLDGMVVSQGLDPYTTPPQAIVDALEPAGLPGADFHKSVLTVEQAELAKLVGSRSGLEKVLSHVHYKQYTTPYPPVSQAVFGLAMKTVPKDGSARRYLITMKIALVFFDLITVGIVILLSRHLSLPSFMVRTLLLVSTLMKEIANSGHLDSIAVCFMSGSILALTYAFWHKNTDAVPSGRPPNQFVWVLISAILLAAAVGAKVFPVVLLPIWFVVCLRRGGWFRSFAGAIVLGGLVLLTMWPMIRHFKVTKQLAHNIAPSRFEAPQENQLDTGLEVFAKYWEMNDLMFMVLVENLKPDETLGQGQTKAWFVFTSNEFRNKAIDTFEERSKAQRPFVAFWIARRATVILFLILVLGFCLHFWIDPTPQNCLSATFLTLAWFWMLAPTQNPWYWTWALPFLVFARCRAWWMVSGLLIAYYLRFYFEYHHSGDELFWYGFERYAVF